MTARAPLLLLSALLVGCVTPLAPTGPAPLGEPFWIGVNELRVVPAANITIRFAQVLEDSRCPVDPGVNCVWAGRVRIELGLRAFVDGEALRELRLWDQPSSVVVDGHRIDLLAIDPKPTMRLPPLGGYRARLRVVALPAPQPEG